MKSITLLTPTVENNTANDHSINWKKNITAICCLSFFPTVYFIGRFIITWLN